MIMSVFHRFSCYTSIRTVDDMQPTPPIPTTDAVVDLYRAVDRDGLAAHTSRIEEFRLAAEHLGADAPLVGLLRDPTAPDAIRVRAIARLASRWQELTATTVDEPVFARTFAALLARWNAHQDLRAVGADTADLAASRRRLDGVRREHAAARRRAMA